MILTNGRRERIDLGPGNGNGQGGIDLVNVIPSLAQDAEETGMTVMVLCAICDNPAPAGKFTCSPKCARAFMGRWTVGR